MYQILLESVGFYRKDDKKRFDVFFRFTPLRWRTYRHVESGQGRLAVRVAAS